MPRFHLPEEGKIVLAGEVDAGNTAIAGAIVDFGKYSHCDIVTIVTDLSSQTWGISLDQHSTTTRGTDTLEFEWMWTNSAANTTDSFVHTAVTSDTFNVDTIDSWYIISVDASDLTDGNRYFHADAALPGGGTPTYFIFYIFSGAKYPSADPPDTR